MKWTPEQNNAITMPVSDIIVSAAAGSGKTAVMAERIIRRLTDENYVDIDKILVVTYTKAAASEIKERVMQKIVEKLATGENPALSKQLIMLSNAHFCTIHSFCLDLIRKYFYKLNIDPEFRIADETEVQLLKKSAVNTIMHECYNNHDENFLRLVSCYTKKHDADLAEMILKVYDFSRTMPNSKQWLDSLTDFYTSGNNIIEEFLCQRAIIVGRYASKLYDDALKVCSQNEGCAAWTALILAEREALNNALKQTNYENMYIAFNSIEFKRWSSPKDVSPALKDVVKGKRDSAKSVIEKIKESYFFSSPEQINKDYKNVQPFVRKIAELAQNVDVLFSELKHERCMIDFSDFEHMALKLLRNEDNSPSDIAMQISEAFEEIYIDEYQDCNNIQNTIFGYISGAIRGCPNVYCVGDMKQSIYRFRDANPMLFRHKCDTYPLYTDGDAKKNNKILLNSNFRSRKSILGFVNSVFSQIMSNTCGELEYVESEMLNYGGGYEDVNPDIENIDIDIIDESNSFDDGKSDKNDNHLSGFEAEAIHIANKIKSYISGGYMLYNKKKQISRPAEYRDIVILLRSPSKTAPVFEQVFNDMNIPVYNDKSDGYFDTEEIAFLIALLKIIDNPDDDISLVTVMKNPIFGFDENELLKFRIAFSKKEASFYSCLKNYTAKYDDTLSAKCLNFLDSLEKWYDKSRYMETDSFISYLINEIDYFTYLSLFADYSLRKTNVRYLLHKAKEFESTNFKGIFSFVRYIENTKSVASPETAKVLSENDNVVRIMSIHRSKGLEFPIVFLSCLGRKFNKTDIRSSYVLHKDFGLGLDSVYKEKSIRVQTLNRAVIKEKINLETVSEELRVLYVALTRPTEKLILTGCYKHAARELNRLEFLLSDEELRINPTIVEKCDTFMTMILLAVLRSEGCQLDSGYGFSTVVADNCKYNISLINKCDISIETKADFKSDWESFYKSQTEYYMKICSMLSYSYPHYQASLIPGNVTVTELKKMYAENDGTHHMFDEYKLAVPEFMSDSKKITGPKLGSLVHFVMEKLPFKYYASTDELKDEIIKLRDSNIISDSEFEALNVKSIYKFFSSNLGCMMIKNVSSLVREFSFKYLLDASKVYDVRSDEKMIVQGTVDAYFEDADGQLIVVDYKTDKVLDGNTEEIVVRYKVQLEHYANALNSITGKNVKSKILYLFDTGDIIFL